MNKNIKDLTGKKFGRLTVLGLSDKLSRKTYWDCICDCGSVKPVRSDSIQNGSIKSCGCLKKEQDATNLNRTTHNKCKTRIYKIFYGMKSRCYDNKNGSYYRYGARGIFICDEWLKDFECFYKWSINNGYSENLTIDRIDNSLSYSPSNCKWSTNKEQCNNRSTNINIKIGNSTKTLTQWCEIFEVDYKTVITRYNRDKELTITELFKSTIS